MRPLTNLALHSALAAALIAFAATSAAAGNAQFKLGMAVKVAPNKNAAPGKDKQTGDGWIEIDSWQFGPRTDPALANVLTGHGAADANANANANKVDVVTVPPITPDANANKVDVVTVPPITPGPGNEKWMRGTNNQDASVTKVDSFTVKQKVKPVSPSSADTSPSSLGNRRNSSEIDVKWDVVDYRAGDAGTPSTFPGTSDMMMKRGTSPASNRRIGSTRGGNVGGGAGLTIGVGTPDQYGRVRIKFPWDACAVGSRYEDAVLRDGNGTYELKDVTVAGCAADGAVFDYSSVTVRGWDPKTKQD